MKSIFGHSIRTSVATVLLLLPLIGSAQPTQNASGVNTLDAPFAAPVLQSRAALTTATAGQIVFDNSSGAFFGLPVGGVGGTAADWVQLNTTGAAGVAANTVWAGPTSGGNAQPTFRALVTADIPAPSVVTKTANYTITSADDVVLVTGASGGFTITLPDATTAGHMKFFEIKRIDDTPGNVIALATTSSQTIDGGAASNRNLNTLNESYRIYSDGANWQISEHKTATPWASDSNIGVSSSFSASSTSFHSRREGDSLRVRGNFTCGSTSASSAYISLSTYTINTSKLASVTNGVLVGQGFSLAGGGAQSITLNNKVHAIFYDGSTNNQLFMTLEVVSNGFNKKNANSICTSSENYTFEVLVPISGWTE